MNLVIRSNKKRIPWPFFIGVGISAIFAYFIFDTLKISKGSFIYVSLFSFPLVYYITFSLVVLFDYLRTLFYKKAVLIINETGISDHLTVFSCGEINWSEIRDVSMVTTTKFKFEFLVIELNDLSKYIDGKNFIQRHVLKGYVRRFGSPVIISKMRVDYDLKELQQIIIEHLP